MTTIAANSNHHEELKAVESPLCQFSVENICNQLDIWIHNDTNYKTNLSRMVSIFEKYSLSGNNLTNIPSKTYQIIQKKIYLHMSQFLTKSTFTIMFKYFDESKQEDTNSFTSKSAEQCARILYDYPLQLLLSKFRNEKINGKKLIRILQDPKNHMIQIITGWEDKEVEQIKLLFLRYWTFNKKQFIDKMCSAFTNKDHQTFIPKIAFDKIKETIQEFDVEELHYKIKNNKNIDDFSEKIINIVDNVTQNNDSDVVYLIYTKIAQCFIVHETLTDDDLTGLQGPYNNWICSDCGNHNFGKCINYKMNYDVSICSLCGIQQIDSIILKIKKGNSYLMVNEIVINKTDNEEKNDIDILMQTVIKAKQINLKCPIRNDNHQCPAILSLGRVLIKYKRWLYTVYVNTKGDDNIDKTVQVN
eukprot:454334_1